jgi:hypothetical protein
MTDEVAIKAQVGHLIFWFCRVHVHFALAMLV